MFKSSERKKRGARREGVQSVTSQRRLDERGTGGAGGNGGRGWDGLRQVYGGK